MKDDGDGLTVCYIYIYIRESKISKGEGIYLG